MRQEILVENKINSTYKFQTFEKNQMPLQRMQNVVWAQFIFDESLQFRSYEYQKKEFNNKRMRFM